MAKRPAAKREKKSGPVKAGSAALGPACRILLLVGEDAFLRAGYTDKLVESIEKAGLAVQVVRFDGATAGPGDVLDECRSPGLLAPYKIVIVDNAELLLREPEEAGRESGGGSTNEREASRPDGSAAGKRGVRRSPPTRREMFERYAQSPCENVTLVLRAETWRKGNLDKMIAAVGVIQPCDRLPPAKAASWVVSRAKKAHQREVAREAADLLVESLNGDLARIDSELQKLAAAAAPGEAITVELVERLVAPVAAERKPWELASHLLNPSPRSAIEKLHELVEECDIDPVPLRWVCMDLATKLHCVVREVAQGTPPYQAGRSLRAFFPPQADMVRRLAREVSPRAAADLLRECVEADLRGKTGQGDPVHGLEALVMRFSEIAR